MKKNLKILHLEDLSSDAELVERELKKGNIQFDKKVVDNKHDFEKALLEFHPDIILSDHSLPAFDSAGALAVVKALGIKAPFILITATISEEYAVEIMKGGAYDYVLKDRLQRLPQAVTNALERFRIEDERQKYLDKVIANEAMLKQTERLAHTGSVSADFTTGITEWSQEMHNILEYKVGEVKPSLETLLKRVHPDDRAEVKEKTEYAMAQLDSLSRNFRLLMDDGRIKYILSELIFERDSNGKLLNVKGYSQDVTEITQARELIEKSEANLKAIIENTDSNIYSLDKNLRYITFNNVLKKSLKDIYGLDIHVGDHVYNFLEKLDPEEAREWENIYSRVLEGKSLRFVKEFKVGDFHNYTSFSINPIWENDKVTGLTGFVYDITDQKKAEAEREKMIAEIIQRNKNLEQFSYIVSHNLRMPVANILGISAILQKSPLDLEEQKEVIDGLAISVNKLDEIIIDLNNILQVKYEASHRKEMVNLAMLVSDIKSSIHNLIDKENVTIQYDFSEMEEMNTVKTYMFSIFFNLISNSIKFHQKNIAPVIEIKSLKLKDKIVLLFKDNGIGIDLKKKGDQVFGLYKRFHPDHADGKGMGLYMVKMQVEGIGGQISISSGINKGTEFKIEFEL